MSHKKTVTLTLNHDELTIVGSAILIAFRQATGMHVDPSMMLTLALMVATNPQAHDSIAVMLGKAQAEMLDDPAMMDDILDVEKELYKQRMQENTRNN